MQGQRLARNSKKLKRKNYIKANVKKIRHIQSKAKQPEDESIQKNATATNNQRLKSVKSTTKKSIKKIGQENRNPRADRLSTKSQLNLPNDNAVSLCMKKFIENIKVSRNVSESRLRKKSTCNSNSSSLESESSRSSLDSLDLQENAQTNIGNKTVCNVKPQRVPTKNPTSNKTSAKTPKKVPPKEFEIVKTIFRPPNHSKAYKNEGCQTAEEASESISSTVLFRYPSNGKSVKTHDTSEQSSQTDIKPKTNVIAPKSNIPSNTFKNDIRKEPMKRYQMNNNSRFQKNSIMNKQAPRNNTNAIQIERQKNIEMIKSIGNISQGQSRPTSNIEDFEKLCEEIGYTNKMSPFARHQTVFQQNDCKKRGNGNYKSMKRDMNRPRGTIALPEHKRNEYLAQIMIRRSSMMKDLNSISDVTNSTEAQHKKMKLQEDLKKMDHAIEIFAQNDLYIGLENR
ncbi:uncharacterized protein LOC111056195 isoform X2 [Nilaparvata lugens]|uniref:uncharacterized protein LOC111056195 isoform X2 n=1 Tax=Nilaparvata lugens TaxID=108931 RepID=UPI00193E43B6|nr:uncharacterized protein LOC111056195 isoform X2 [Nilaparvata lugens]